MKLATLRDGTRDGRLVVVARDLARCVAVPEIARTLQGALDEWIRCAPALAAISDELCAGRLPDAVPFDPAAATAPLPRAFQWADGSAYLNHVELVRRARGAEPPADLHDEPLMYQGGSDDFLGPCDDLPCSDREWGIDFEAEVAVVTGDVPMGATPEAALEGVRLLMLANDWTLRALVPAELAKGFGFVQSKPATAFAPVAATPDELGAAWRGGRVHLALDCTLNGVRVGHCDAGAEMHFHFGQLIAHLARTRKLRSGSIVGGGTVSNRDRARGWSCIAEQRAIETIERGAPATPYMGPGDRVRIEMPGADGTSVFGAIDQRVTAPAGA